MKFIVALIVLCVLAGCGHSSSECSNGQCHRKCDKCPAATVELKD